MSKQIITSPRTEASTNSFPEIRIDEYNARDSVVFVVYERERCWKRISPNNEGVPRSGSSSLQSETAELSPSEG